MKKSLVILIISSLIFALTGCLYPEERLKKNRTPYPNQLQSVQTAIEHYQNSKGGLLPIKTRDFNTPIYQKYPVDFNELIPDFMQDAPGNSFENGGTFLYVLVNVEEDPTVKLIDLVTVTTVQTVKMRLDAYKSNYRYPPVGEALGGNVFAINFEKLGYKTPPSVESPYSDNYLPIVITNEGDLMIDYRQDLYEMLKASSDHGYEYGDDVRELLVNETPFVPVYSTPYTINEKNEPIFLAK
jgi:hypothetical protein